MHAYPLPGERLKVTWQITGGQVEVAVSDGGSATTPHNTHPTVASVSGRGLAIVAHICQTWGITANDVGLTVWAVLSAPAQDGEVSQNGQERQNWHTAAAAAAAAAAQAKA